MRLQRRERKDAGHALAKQTHAPILTRIATYPETQMSTLRAPIEALPMPRKDEESRNTVLDRKNARTRQRCTAQALWHAINAERENSANGASIQPTAMQHPSAKRPDKGNEQLAQECSRYQKKRPEGRFLNSGVGGGI